MDTAARTPLAWIAAALTGALAPALGLWALAGVPVAPILAIGMMGAGMIGAAAAGRWQVGAALAALSGIALVLLARAVSPALGLAIAAASLSFAARGGLFARSAGARGWWIALAVVAGEGAMLAVAAAEPGALPGWLLALLPAQWASMALGAALAGTSAPAPLLALAGTAATTLLVARLWPARWPYAIMFTAWLGLAALVAHTGGLTP
ncbi:hypothetical protein ACLBKU_08295 [Erythrobacter sp. NE805]|uniref:hypothetical protein n=1 Tax=Erythrobacter sp. NE805 TaxID=3389875 RepID=UPI00396B3AFD